MPNQNPPKKEESKVGRKWFDGKKEEEVIPKLEIVFGMDGTVEEACFFADISTSAFYRYWDAHPEFREKVKALRQKPILKARQTVVSRLGESYQNAMDYLKRKRRKEFGENIDITSAGEKIEIPILCYGKDDPIQRNIKIEAGDEDSV